MADRSAWRVIEAKESARRPRGQAQILGHVPSVSGRVVFGKRRVGIFFFQGRSFEGLLLVSVVNASRRSIEKSFRAKLFCGHHQMRVDENRQHTKGFVVFDEAHPAHVGGEVVNDLRPVERSFASVELLQIKLKIFHLGKMLVPFGKWFEIDRTNVLMTLAAQLRNQMAANKTSRSANNDFLCIHIRARKLKPTRSLFNRIFFQAGELAKNAGQEKRIVFQIPFPKPARFATEPE